MERPDGFQAFVVSVLFVVGVAFILGAGAYVVDAIFDFLFGLF